MSNIITEMIIGIYIVSCIGIDCAIVAQSKNNPFPHDILSGMILILLFIMGSIALEFIANVLSP
jgi:hypothetical protein